MHAKWADVAELIGLAGAERDDFAASSAETDAAEAALIELMVEIGDLPGEGRHAELVAWCRSDLWSPLLMMLVGWQGEIARAAWRALRVDLEADTPGRRWDSLDPAIGRASILRLLGMTDVPAAFYAVAPFRTWIDDDERAWIAGAVGCPPVLDAAAAGRWRHLDIREVVLWCPQANEARIAGEHASTSSFVMPDLQDRQLTVWGDCRAFFRAWAAARARTGELAMQQAAGEWAHPIIEPTDGGLPGALVVGALANARWPICDAETIIAGDGVSVSELQFVAAKTLMPTFAGQLSR